MGLIDHEFNLDFAGTSRHIKQPISRDFGNESDITARKMKCSAEDGSSPRGN